jgi:hypothetical protein
MAHRFDDTLKLDPNGAPLAAGPVDPPSEDVYRIWVWVSQNDRGAAARGSRDWGNNPVTPRWDCPTTLFQDSKRFVPGDAEGMAVALVKRGNDKEYYGWWHGPIQIVP